MRPSPQSLAGAVRALTATKVLYASGERRRHGVREQGVSFWQKPFTSKQLAHELRLVLDAPSGRSGTAGSGG